MEEHRRPDDRRVRTGKALLLALVVLAATVFFLDEVLDAFRPTTGLVLTTRRADGLTGGGEVRVAGRRGGRVTGVEFVRMPRAGGSLRAIDVELTRDAARMLRADATARIGSASLLGTAIVSIDPGSPGSGPLDLSDTLEITPTLGREELLERGDSLRAELDILNPLVDELLVRTREGPGTMAALRRDTALLRSLRASAARGADLRDRARGGTLARLMVDDSLHAALGRVLELAGTTDTAAADRVTAAALTEDLRTLGHRLERLEAGLESGRGSLGRALHDDALRRELRLLRARTDSLTAELAEDPFRWVRFRLF